MLTLFRVSTGDNWNGILKVSNKCYQQFSDIVSFIFIVTIMLALLLDLSVLLALSSKSFSFFHSKKSFQRRSQIFKYLYRKISNLRLRRVLSRNVLTVTKEKLNNLLLLL